MRPVETSDAHTPLSGSAHQPGHYCSERLTGLPNLYIRCQGHGENGS